MRRGQITPKVIALAKRLKELGFPQEVEVGDWYGYMTYTDEIFCLAENEMLIGKPCKETETFTVPSLSVCLEWLTEKGFFVELGKLYDEGWVCIWRARDGKTGDTPLEAALSAIVAVMEEQ